MHKKHLYNMVISAMLAVSLPFTSLNCMPSLVSAAENVSDSKETNIINGDFEDGWNGWTTLTGEPITDDTNDVGFISKASTYWDTRDFLKHGSSFLEGAPKESKDGKIRSSWFTLSGEGYIAFLIGGANPDSGSCVELYAEAEEAGGTDTLIKTYQNKNFKDPDTGRTLLRIYDKLDDYLGKNLYFVIVNGSKPGFSFIDADDFRVSMTKDQALALQKEDIKRIQDTSDDYKEHIFELYKNATLYDTDTPLREKTGAINVAMAKDSITVPVNTGINLENAIADSAEVEDEYGFAIEFTISVNNVLNDSDNDNTPVSGDYKNFQFTKEGNYTVGYAIQYNGDQSKTGTFKVTVEPRNANKIVNGDFETGDLTGWTMLDNNNTPVTNNNNTVGSISNKKTYWSGQYYYQNGEYFLDGTGMESKSGKIRSSSFTLGGDGYISFMIGGAKEEKKGSIKLYCEAENGEDKLVATYTNKHWNDPKTGCTLIRMYDKLDEYLGKDLYFVIENGTDISGFAFINADDFRTSLTKEEVIQLQNEQLEAVKNSSDPYKDYIISCFGANGIIYDLMIEKDLEGTIDQYDGLTVDLVKMIEDSVSIINSYSKQKLDIDVKINSVKFNNEALTETDFSKLTFKKGSYLVDYTRQYEGKTENKSFTINVKEIDKSVNEVENGGFETGDLSGWEILNEEVWTKEEDGKYKGVVSAKTYWGEKLPYNQEGEYHLDGWAVTGEEPATWGVKSSVFVLDGSGWISVRMGGNAAQVKVYKLDGTLIGSYNQTRFKDANFPFTGENNGSWADMGTCFIDLHEYIGEPLYLELRDKSISGGWAAAFFDDVKCYYKDVPAVETGFDTVEAPIGRDETDALIYGNVNLLWTQLQPVTAPEKAVYLSFDNDKAFTVINSEGSKQTVTLESVFAEPKYQDNPVEPYRPDGVSGKSLNFDGYSNCLSYDENIEGSKITIDAYVCPRAFRWGNPGSNYEDLTVQVFAGSYNAEQKRGFLLGVTKHGYIVFRAGTGNNWYALASDNGKCISTYEWSRVTAVFNGDAGTMTIYINGEAVGTKKIAKGTEIAPTGTPVIIGKGCAPEGMTDGIFDLTMFNGLMDEVQISRTAMTAQEVKESTKVLPDISYEDAMNQDSALLGDWYRPTYHAVPSANWMNEPHALFQYNGKWHLFYQASPSGPFWHNISWGHWVSNDMVNWKFVKEAVIPTEGTVTPDGVWTGNVIFTKDGEPLLLITAGDDSRSVNGSNQHVGLVRADDYSDPNLTDWTVIGFAMAQTKEMGTIGEFRDAQAFGIGDERYMVVGGEIDKVVDGKIEQRGAAHVFKTTAKSLEEWEAACKKQEDGTFPLNGMDWEYKGSLFEDYFDTHNYDETYGIHWEMPNIAPLRTEDGEETGKYLFVFSPHQGKADINVHYYIGTFNTNTCQFVPDPEFDDGAKLMDYGDQIFSGPTVYLNPADQKVYICSIMQDGVVGHEAGRLVGEHYYAGWAYYAGLPRELYLKSDGTLGIKNIDTSSIEGRELVSFEGLTASEANKQLAEVNSNCIKIEFEFTGDASSVGFKLQKDDDGFSNLYLTDSLLGLDNKSGSYKKGKTVKGVIYVDKCSVEAYIDNNVTISGSKFRRGKGLEVVIDGTATCSVKVTELHSIHNTLDSIKVTTPPTKTEYVEGESFDPAGMIVTAVYSDDTEREAAGFTILPSGALDPSVDKVTVTFTDGKTRTAYVPITVKAKSVVNPGNQGSNTSSSTSSSTDPNKNDNTEPDTNTDSDPSDANTSDKDNITVSTEVKEDGTKVETITEKKPDGTVVKTITEEKPTGSTIKTVVEQKTDGSCVEKKEVTVKDKSASLNTVVEIAADGKVSANAVIRTGIVPSNGKVEISTELLEPIADDENLTNFTIEITSATIDSADVSGKNTKVTITIPKMDSASANVDNIVLSKDSVQSAKSTGKGLTVTISSGEDYNYNVTIPVKQLVKISNSIENFDLTVNTSKVSDVSKKKLVTAITKGKANKNKTCVVSLAANNNAKNVGLKLKVSVSKKSSIKDGATVYVYKYNQATGKLEEAANSKQKVAKDGMVAIAAASGTDYVVSAKKLTGNKVETIKDNIKISVNKTQVKTGKKANVSVTLPDTVSTGSKFGTEKATITYKSNNTNIAAVSKTGVIKASSKGTVVITTVVKLSSGQKVTNKQKITVK